MSKMKKNYKIYWRETIDKYEWVVYNRQFETLATGICDNYDDAFRTVRNFINNNQNLVYGDTNQND